MKAASAAVALSLIAAPVALCATAAAAQQDPAERARIEELTRRLNGAPPSSQAAPRSPAPAAAPPPSQAAPRPPATPQDPAERARIEELTRRLNGAPPISQPAPQPAPQTPSRPAPAPVQAAPQPAPSTARQAPPPAPPARGQAVPQAAPPAPQPEGSQPVRRAPPASAPAATPRAVAPVPPSPQGLSAAERAALPFRIDLPPEFDLVEGRAAPGAHVYSAQKAGKTYLMIYAGPSSQFPIYDGDHVPVGGRVSVVTTDGARRIAMEHLFQRATQPAEIHVWLMAQDGAARDEAERIAQTVDPK